MIPDLAFLLYFIYQNILDEERILFILCMILNLLLKFQVPCPSLAESPDPYKTLT